MKLKKLWALASLMVGSMLLTKNLVTFELTFIAFLGNCLKSMSNSLTSYSYSSKNPISFLLLPHLFKNNITMMILSLGLQTSFHWKVGIIISCW